MNRNIKSDLNELINNIYGVCVTEEDIFYANEEISKVVEDCMADRFLELLK